MTVTGPISAEYPDGAVNYRAFLESVFGGWIRQPTLFDLPALPSELELQSLWFSGAWGRDFTSTCGKPVHIRQFGHWNRAAGPDFTETAVEVDGELLKGAIELDVEAQDWERHGHGQNPDFNGVVLHLFPKRESSSRFYTRTLEHREVVQVELDLQEVALATRPSSVAGLPEAKLGRCAMPLRNMDSRRINSLLTAAAQHRLEAKSQRIARTATIHGRAEAIFQGVAEALGYRPNKVPMRVLAQRFPLKELRKLDSEAVEARLFGTAGFLTNDRFENATEDTRAYLRGLWDTWWKLREGSDLPDLGWKLSGIRPQNHPQRRIGAMAAFVEMSSKWSSQIPGNDATPSRTWPTKFRKLCTELAHPYWSHHFTLHSKPSSKPMALIGKDRVQDILGNTLFPLVLQDHPDQWSLYMELPASQENEKLRRAMIRLFGDNPEADQYRKRFYHQQGVLQVYEDYCLEDWSECEDCPFPEQLLQW